MVPFISKAFTLVELLVVIAIISVLAGMLLPALENAIESAQTITCVNNLKQNSTAISMYINDNHGYFPLSRSSGPTYYYRDLLNGYMGIGADVPLNTVSSQTGWFRGTWKNLIHFCPSCEKEDDWSNSSTACYGTYGTNPNLMASWDITKWYRDTVPARVTDSVRVGDASKRILLVDNYSGSILPWPYFWIKGDGTTVAKFRHNDDGSNDDTYHYTLPGAGQATTLFVDGHVELLFEYEIKNENAMNGENWTKLP